MDRTNMFPNQRSIRINKEVSDSENLYAIINLDALNLAIGILSPNAFKLWMYLDKIQRGYEFALSRQSTMGTCHFSKGTYRKAFDELVTEAYLVETGKNQYDFYELPKSEDVLIRIRKTDEILKELSEEIGA